jgi:transporter family-2 protein
MHWYLIAIGVGICVALQPTVNAALRREVGVAPTLILGAALVLIASIAVGMAWPEEAKWDRLTKVRPDLWAGAIFGMCIIVGGMTAVPKLGAGPALGLILLGQLAFGLIIDHFGWYGVPQSPVTWTKGLGVAVIFGGFLLVNKG